MVRTVGSIRLHDRLVMSAQQLARQLCLPAVREPELFQAGEHGAFRPWRADLLITEPRRIVVEVKGRPLGPQAYIRNSIYQAAAQALALNADEAWLIAVEGAPDGAESLARRFGVQLMDMDGMRSALQALALDLECEGAGS